MSNDLELENAKLKLKVQALNERISEISVDNENKIADLRVDLTLLSQRNQTLESQLQQVAQVREAHFTQTDGDEAHFEVLEGEVVDD